MKEPDPISGGVEAASEPEADAPHAAQAKAPMKKRASAKTIKEDGRGNMKFERGGGHSFIVNADGVWSEEMKSGDEGEPQPKPEKTWICSRLNILARTRTTKSREWGRLLQWEDADEVVHQWAMPASLTQGDSVELRKALVDLGLEIGGAASVPRLLVSYIITWPTQARATCTDKLGWHGHKYVLPQYVAGECATDKGERVVFQSAHAVEPQHAQSGTAQGWRDGVAALALGNDRLMVAISAALAGPLMAVAKVSGGIGFHLRGKSSTGKSTALSAGASVYGCPKVGEYIRTWRTTSNGLEGIAAVHNDGFLVLDEIGEVAPEEIGPIVYMLGNGSGKLRANKLGMARAAQTWQTIFFSSGEESVADLLRLRGRTSKAGQDVRLIEVDADAGVGYGLFQELHGMNAADLADQVKLGGLDHHGVVGMEWIELLAGKRRAGDLSAHVRLGMATFVSRVAEDEGGQVQRVAGHFALVAVAGELASEWGLTGWPEGAASDAAKACFDSWKAGFGVSKGSANSKEDLTTMQRVRAFLEAHGSSRFEDVEPPTDQRTGEPVVRAVINRAGFFRNKDGSREHLVLAEAMKNEVLKGLNLKDALRTLVERGWLRPDAAGKNTRPENLPGIGKARVYVLTPKALEDEL